MVENNDRFSPQIPCMYDNTKPCVDCNIYSINLENIRRLARNEPFKRLFSYYMGDFPTWQNVADLLSRTDEEDPVTHTETFHSTTFPKKLKDLAKDLNKQRREYVIKRFSRFNDDDYAFEVHCSNYNYIKKEED